jgi:hypothetical protein
MQSIRVLATVAVMCIATITRADGTTRVAVIDTARLYDAGGITRWVTARAKLDVDRKILAVRHRSTPHQRAAPDAPEAACARSSWFVSSCCTNDSRREPPGSRCV